MTIQKLGNYYRAVQRVNGLPISMVADTPALATLNLLFRIKKLLNAKWIIN